MDEKPPPYECSSCTFTTWSWNEAKKHICGTQTKEKDRIVKPTTARSVLYASITASLLKPLIQLLERASDGSTGEFKESTITLPSDPGHPLTVHVRRGAPDRNQAQKAFAVSLEISQDE